MLKIKEFFDQKTNSLSYVLDDSGQCIIIDSLLNYDQFSGKISHEAADEIIKYIQKNDFELVYIMETHIHADHLTGNDYIKQKAKELGFGKNAKSVIGENVTKVTKYWGKVFEFEEKSLQNASDFDILAKEGQKLKFGEVQIEVISTPGHTPCCVCYKIEDNLFVGDVMFMPDVGTARCDFPGGSAEDSYHSIQKIYALNDSVRVYPAHDYPPENRGLMTNCSILEQKQKNKMIKGDTKFEEFYEARTKRDKVLDVPKLLYPSLQINIFAGKIKGKKFMKIPIKIN